MDKRIDGLAGAMREIAEKRDSHLRNAGAVSADRVKRLQALVAAQFSVETALVAAARKRDESLSAADPTLPLAVHAALSERVRGLHAAANSFDLLHHFFAWVKAPGLHRVYQTAALAAAAILITATALYFPHLNKPVAPQSLPPSLQDQNSLLLSPDWPFERSGDRLTLRLRRVELASLEPSIFSLNGALPAPEQPDRALPFDLPIRQIRLDVEALRTP